MKRVLLTGANGFVGRRLSQELRANGWRVREVVRRPSEIESSGVESVQIEDIAAHPDWSEILQNVDVVVHLAARAHVMNDRGSNPLDLYRTVNVSGTARLAEASLEAGVRRFVYVSSVKAVGEGEYSPPGSPSPIYTEETPCRPQDAYGISKLEAEQAMLQAARGGGMETVIVRPPLVYGPEVRANYLRLMKAVAHGIPLPLGAVQNARSMVYIGNLAHALSLSCEHPNAAGETFLVADGEPLSTRELVERMGRAMERPARLFPVPVSFLRLAGRALGRLDEVDRLVGSLVVSTARIRERLGWIPPYTEDEGLRETANWLRRAAGDQR